MPTVPERRRQRGFTLLEVIVALAIAGFGVVALFEAASGGLIAVDTASRYRAATLEALRHVEELGVMTPLAAGERQGAADGMRWRLRVTPLATKARGDTRSGPGLTLYAVDIDVTWRAGQRDRAVQLSTFRLGPPPPVAP